VRAWSFVAVLACVSPVDALAQVAPAPTGADSPGAASRTGVVFGASVGQAMLKMSGPQLVTPLYARVGWRFVPPLAVELSGSLLQQSYTESSEGIRTVRSASSLELGPRVWFLRRLWAHAGGGIAHYVSTLDGSGTNEVVAVGVVGLGVEAVQREHGRMDIGAKLHYLDAEKNGRTVWALSLHVGFGWR
jgi:hypothetical protein